ncbi:MAG: AAA family ATPase [Methylorubrum populi]
MAYPVLVVSGENHRIINLEERSTNVFVGANGSGKTRLAVKIEQTYPVISHRVSAHRALNLDPEVEKISEEQAETALRKGGFKNMMHFTREQMRWKNNPHVNMLDDFKHLIQLLFAEQSNTALITHVNARSGNFNNIRQTKFEVLSNIWHKLIPHRELHVTGDNILVSAGEGRDKYPASDLSDGERALFYIIGQVIAASVGSILIFDEPELHVHKSILARMWDELEAARSDCTYVIITHDLEFAASRVGQKFVIRDFSPARGWTIESVPENIGFSEEITTLILGSRRPILFVEGRATSLDLMIYRSCYPEWTVIPRESCEQVIHAVATMRANQSLTRVTCFGIVDADDHDESYLATLGVAALPVSEIENLLLLPDIGRAILEKEGYVGAEVDQRLSALKQELFNKAQEIGAIDRVVARHCRRRIDRMLKKIDLSAAVTLADISAEYGRQTAALDVATIGAEAEGRIRQAIKEDNLPAFLRAYDDKNFLAIASKHLKATHPKDFMAWLSRVLRNDSVPSLTTAIRGHIPEVTAR